MIRLILADDHPVVREGLKRIIDPVSDVAVVAEVENGPDAVRAAEVETADVMLLDISMPGPGIEETLTRINKVNPNLRVLVLSIHPPRHYALRVLRAGAAGYLTKGQSATELLVAIRTVFSGRSYLSEPVAQRLAEIVRSGSDASPIDSLSRREMEVLSRIGAGRSTQEIAEDLHLSPKTVETYRSRIREKLDLKTMADLVRFAVDQGLVE